MLSKIIINYDVLRYPFAKMMASHLGVEDLRKVHELYSFPRLTKKSDQGTELHRLMYRIGPMFHAIYKSFLSEQIVPLVGERIIYQRMPNFRVQIPGNVGVGDFHRDCDNNHSATEINFWVPLTEVNDHNTLWIESMAGLGDFRPVSLRLGQFLAFDGASLMHGNHVNLSARSRVSFDFRVIPESLYKDNMRRTVVMNSLLCIGDYWSVLADAHDHGDLQ